MKIPSYLPLAYLAFCAVACAGPAADPALFDRSHMAEADLSGLKVWLGKPVEVTAQLAWGTDWLEPNLGNGAGKDPKWTHGWSFVHPTPYMARFPEGQLVAMYALDPDSNDNSVFVSGFQISKDGGGHWGRRYSFLMEHQAMVFVPQKNDSLLAVQSQMMPRAPGDERNFTGPAYLFEHGGERLQIIPDGVRIVDLPWPVGLYPGTEPPDSWRSQAAITGDVLEVGGRFLATGYAIKKGETLMKSILFVSEDGGYTWRYFSTIAEADLSLVTRMGRQDPDLTAVAPLANRYGFVRADGAAIVQLANTIAAGPLTDATVAPLADKLLYEGPNETSVIALANGDLIAVFRVGEGWNLYRNYSHDGGRTWTTPAEIPAYSVFPRLIRAADGAIALVTGRPGLDLWISNDPKASSWQRIDLAAYHNHWETDPYRRIISFPNTLVRLLRGNTMWQTSSYTGVVEVAPNQLLVCYDRCPEIAPSGPQDLSRIYVMPIEIAAGAP